MAIPNPIVKGLAASARWSAWARALALAKVALAIKRHLDLLDGREKAELRRLVTKSKGRPSNLSARERNRLNSLVEKLEPRDLAREAAAAVVPIGAGRIGKR